MFVYYGILIGILIVLAIGDRVAYTSWSKNGIYKIQSNRFDDS